MIKEEDTLKNTQTVQTIKNKEKELELKKQKLLVRRLNIFDRLTAIWEFNAGRQEDPSKERVRRKDLKGAPTKN